MFNLCLHELLFFKYYLTMVQKCYVDVYGQQPIKIKNGKVLTISWGLYSISHYYIKVSWLALVQCNISYRKGVLGFGNSRRSHPLTHVLMGEAFFTKRFANDNGTPIGSEELCKLVLVYLSAAVIESSHTHCSDTDECF